MKTKEDIFRIKGKQIGKLISCATYLGSLGAIVKLVKLEGCFLNKEELQELIDWLITKHDEMD